MRNIVIVFLLCVAVLCVGCASGYVSFYEQVAPEKYPPPADVMVFSYPNADLNDIYEMYFAKFLVVGRASFVGRYQDPRGAFYFARSIGADVLITSIQSAGSVTRFVSIETPTSQSTHISGYSSLTGSFFANVTEYKTKTTTIPVTVNRYAQQGMYLKNMSETPPVWEWRRDMVDSTGTHSWLGQWRNQRYTLELVRAGEQLLAFLSAPITPVASARPRRGAKGRPWRVGDLVFAVGVNEGYGVYVMGDKSPQPARVYENKFGHLVVRLLLDEREFSFGRPQ